MKTGRFRSDLFYRLNVYSIHLLPLRERREDILPLAEHFLSTYAAPRGFRFDSFPGETVGTSITDEVGTTLGFIAVIRDITDRRRAEELDRQHQAELAHMSRLNTMGEMATGIAHELNQPLTAIATYADAALRLVRAGIRQPDRLEEALLGTRDQAVRAGDIIRHLRQFVSKQNPQVKAVDLNELVNRVIGFTESEIKKRGVSLSLQLAPGLPKVMADGIQIEQVLLNLIRNSLDAFQGGQDDCHRSDGAQLPELDRHRWDLRQ